MALGNTDTLQEQIALLRREIAAIADTVNDYGSHRLRDARRSAVALGREMRHHGEIVAHEASRQAGAAGRAVRENPIPVIVALGTIALLSSLVFRRD